MYSYVHAIKSHLAATESQIFVNMSEDTIEV